MAMSLNHFSIRSLDLDACERFYQAFQFVVWAGKSAKEALDLNTYARAEAVRIASS